MSQRLAVPLFSWWQHRCAATCLSNHREVVMLLLVIVLIINIHHCHQHYYCCCGCCCCCYYYYSHYVGQWCVCVCERAWDVSCVIMWTLVTVLRRNVHCRHARLRWLPRTWMYTGHCSASQPLCLAPTLTWHSLLHKVCRQFILLLEDISLSSDSELSSSSLCLCLQSLPEPRCVTYHHHHHIRFWYLWCCSCPGLRGRQHLATPHTRSPWIPV